MKNDNISRQSAIDALKAMAVPLHLDMVCEDIWERDRTLDNAIDVMRGLPPAQPEPAIPLSWIENYIKWLNSLDNGFSTLEALQIGLMVRKWKDEQDDE